MVKDPGGASVDWGAMPLALQGHAFTMPVQGHRHGTLVVILI
jgi:hypothetical protein